MLLLELLFLPGVHYVKDYWSSTCGQFRTQKGPRMCHWQPLWVALPLILMSTIVFHSILNWIVILILWLVLQNQEALRKNGNKCTFVMVVYHTDCSIPENRINSRFAYDLENAIFSDPLKQVWWQVMLHPYHEYVISLLNKRKSCVGRFDNTVLLVLRLNNAWAIIYGSVITLHY